MGIISIIIGVVALVLSWVPFINNFAAIVAVIGLVFGVVGLFLNRKHKKIFSWIGDVCTELNLSDFKARKLLNEMLANEIISEHGKSVAHRYRFNLNDEYSRFAVQQIFHQQEEFMLKGFD